MTRPKTKPSDPVPAVAPVPDDAFVAMYVGAHGTYSSLETVLDDGRSATIKPGDSYTIPPGHTARVLGDTAFEALEFASAAVYAVPPQ